MQTREKVREKVIKITIVIETAIIVIGFFILTDFPIKVARNVLLSGNAASPALANSEFYYNFNVDGVLEESASIDKSHSPYWWLNYGGLLIIKDGIGMTVQNNLDKFSIWRVIYDRSNPVDTDGGLHPQNIFRLFTRSSWQGIQSEAYFKINKYNLSSSPNRNASNGVFLISRFQDKNNLYYFGMRVDGEVIIKKKYAGVYYSVASTKVFSGTYNKTNPNLLPLGSWIGLRAVTENNSDGTVNLNLFIDLHNNGNWQEVLDTVDDSHSYGGLAILKEGHAGIRTDFMDVEFRDYLNVELW